MTYHPEAVQFLLYFFGALGVLLLFALPRMGLDPRQWLEKWLLVGSFRMLEQADIPRDSGSRRKNRRKRQQQQQSLRIRHRIWLASTAVIAVLAVLDATYLQAPFQLRKDLPWPLSLSLVGAATLIIYAPALLGITYRRWTFWLSVLTTSFVVFQLAALLPIRKGAALLVLLVWFSSFCFTFGLLSRIDRNTREQKAIREAEMQ